MAPMLVFVKYAIYAINDYTFHILNTFVVFDPIFDIRQIKCIVLNNK